MFVKCALTKHLYEEDDKENKAYTILLLSQAYVSSKLNYKIIYWHLKLFSILKHCLIS